jgi:tRNA(Arg) A34 adenosine deaminase TadA
MNLTLYVVRLAASGIRHSGPCENCLSIIKKIGIRKIVFSCDNGKFEMHTVRNYISYHITHGFKHIKNDIKL